METPQELEDLKQVPATEQIHPLIAHRWSPRAFSGQPVSDADLKKIFSAAHWAASSYNEQPWRFLVGRKGDATYQKIFNTLVEFNQEWAKSAPVLVLSAAKKNFSHNNTPNNYAVHDLGAATATLMLQATAQGMHTHSMAGFDMQKARTAFNIPEEYEIGAVTAIGFLGDLDKLPDNFRKQESAGRQRKPLEEVVFSEWGTPAKL